MRERAQAATSDDLRSFCELMAAEFSQKKPSARASEAAPRTVTDEFSRASFAQLFPPLRAKPFASRAGGGVEPAECLR